MDKSARNVLYNIAFCYEDMAQPEKARQVWSFMSREFSSLGYDVEADLAAEKAVRLK